MASPAYRNWLMCREVANKDPLVDAILDGHVEGQLLADAKEIMLDKVIRVYVEACLLATEDFDQIAETLELDKHTLMLYHDIYYDVHSLSRIHKVEHLSKIEDPEERSFKQWALTGGMKFVQWRLGINVKISATESLVELQSDAYFRSKEAFFNGNTADAAQEGLKWSRHATALAKLISDMQMDGDELQQDFELALERITEENMELPSIDQLIGGGQ